MLALSFAVHVLAAPPQPTGCLVTVVTMAYNLDRARYNLGKIYSRYGNMNGTVCELIVVWNNKAAPIPVMPPSSTPVPIKIVFGEENSLNERWKHCATAKTRAVVTIDDDLLIDQVAIECLLMAWNGNEFRVVGMDPRRVLNSASPELVYGNFPRNNAAYAVVITGTSIVSPVLCRRYMEHTELVDYVNAHRNYEDIAMNAVATKPPLFVDPCGHRWGLVSTGGISSQGSTADQRRIRTRGLRWITNHLQVEWKPTREIFTCPYMC
jgi:hypothetical protein